MHGAPSGGKPVFAPGHKGAGPVLIGRQVNLQQLLFLELHVRETFFYKCRKREMPETKVKYISYLFHAVRFGDGKGPFFML